MRVRNDEELRNLRKIGIFGVRLGNYSRDEPDEYFLVVESLVLGRNSV